MQKIIDANPTCWHKYGEHLCVKAVNAHQAAERLGCKLSEVVTISIDAVSAPYHF